MRQYAEPTPLTFHILNDSVVKERFRYDETPGIHIGFVRGFRRAAPRRLTMQKNFSDCWSWLDLPGLEGVELAPVISEDEHVAKRDALQTCWADLANDFYDRKMPTIPFETIASRSELSFRGAQALALKVFSNSLTASMISSKSGTSPKNMGPSMAW